MSTTQYNPTSSPGVLIGNWAAQANYAGQQARQVSATGDLWAATLTGTDATLNCFCGGATSSTTISVSVDGGSFANYAAVTGFAYQDVPLFTGLSDAAHTVLVKFTLNDALRAASTALSVTGASPAYAAPTEYPNYTRIGDNPSGISNEGSVAFANNFNQKTQYSSFATFGPRFKATTDLLKIFAINLQGRWGLEIDGVLQAGRSTALASGGASAITDLSSVWTLDGANEHTYQLLLSSTIQTGSIEGIFVKGFNSTALTARDAWSWYGDSVLQGLSGTSSDSLLGCAYLTSQAKGVQCQNKAIGGTYVSGGGATTGAVRYADVTGASPAPKAVIVLYGFNDLAGSVTQSTFAAAYQTMATGLASGLPNVPIYLCSLEWSGNSTLRGQYNTSIAAVAAATGGRVQYLSLSGLLLPPYNFNPTSGSSTADGLHPNATGYGQMDSFFRANILPTVPICPASLFAVGL